jgi:hypothetical protein
LNEVDHGGRDAKFEVCGGLTQTGDLPDVLRTEARGQGVERCDALFTK